jgi:hypothetical protein
VALGDRPYLVDPPPVLVDVARNSVVIRAFTTSRARAEPMILPPMHRTLVSKCDLARDAQNGSWQTAASTPWTRLAIRALP